jgi:hypothetical protein
MSRIFLHVGSPKTGTTFLQQVLWSQRDLALAHGLLLPLRSVQDHFFACLDLRESQHLAEHPERVRGSWRHAVAEIAAHAGDALVSHELFAQATPEQAERGVADLVATGREVHVVITARDLARQLPAQWQEVLKAGGVLTFEEFLREARAGSGVVGSYLARVQDYAALARRFGGRLPPGRVHVVTVPPAGAPRGLLWERFARVVGLDPQAFSLDVPRANESLGREQAELLRLVNLALDGRIARPGPYPAVVKGLYAHRILAARPGARITLPADDLALARDRSAAMVADLVALGVDVAGDLDDLLVPDGVPAGDAETPEDTVLLTEAVAATAALLEAHAAARAEHRAAASRLRGRVRELEQAPARRAWWRRRHGV